MLLGHVDHFRSSAYLLVTIGARTRRGEYGGTTAPGRVAADGTVTLSGTYRCLPGTGPVLSAPPPARSTGGRTPGRSPRRR
ncbi:DUF6299 family protein [Streptomyces griseoluteus]|uniref:DUF6299 family protein n=1 Tax=Streptomyces griseoluteus TaxID=29306 RepID=UPI003571388A